MAMTKSQIKSLEKIRRVAAFEDFGGSDITIGGKTYGPFDRAATAAIIEATRIYRETWLLPEIDALIKQAKEAK